MTSSSADAQIFSAAWDRAWHELGLTPATDALPQLLAAHAGPDRHYQRRSRSRIGNNAGRSVAHRGGSAGPAQGRGCNVMERRGQGIRCQSLCFRPFCASPAWREAASRMRGDSQAAGGLARRAPGKRGEERTLAPPAGFPKDKPGIILKNKTVYSKITELFDISNRFRHQACRNAACA